MDITLRENIDWVGYVDWTVRDFHSYDTARGATYNAYLIRDEKTALIDAVKGPFGENLLTNVAALTDVSKIDYVVCNHAEPDHAGALPAVMAALPQATLVCNQRCRDALAAHFDVSAWRFEIVGSSKSLSLGRRTLQFLDTPMVHWPESMFTYVPEEKLLFSMDAFGQHYATSFRFDDQVSLPTAMDEAKTYYANIVMPYGKQVAATLDAASKWPIEMIAPSHGVIWRAHAAEIVRAYADWSVCRAKSKVLVVYDTMWESTERMAQAIHQGACQPGVDAQLIHLRRSNLTRLAAEVLDASVVALGSATLNRGMMPAMGAALTYLEGLRPSGKAGMAFGSYGWGRGAAEAIDAWLAHAGWEVLSPPVRCCYRPTPDLLDQCRRLGVTLADRAARV